MVAVTISGSQVMRSSLVESGLALCAYDATFWGLSGQIITSLNELTPSCIY